MCHLAAYIGDRPIAPLLLKSLKLQEGYFGGQATGLATIKNGKIKHVKKAGPVDYVKANSDIMTLNGSTGIAHSRFSINVLKGPEYNGDQNAHPWLNEDETIVLAHNGIIRNYKEHWENLKKDYIFTSYSPFINDITDSEVAIHLLDQKVRQGKELGQALKETANSLMGMVLLCVMHFDEPETIYLTNWIQACYLGVGNNETIFSSSKLGLKHVWEDFNVFHAPRNSFIVLNRDGIEISKLDPKRSAPDPPLNYEIMLEKVNTILQEKGKIDTVAIFLELEKNGFKDIFGLNESEWKKLRKIGYGDQNQLMEPLDRMTEAGVIKKKTFPRLEGGKVVPRIMWSL